MAKDEKSRDIAPPPPNTGGRGPNQPKKGDRDIAPPPPNTGGRGGGRDIAPPPPNTGGRGGPPKKS